MIPGDFIQNEARSRDAAMDLVMEAVEMAGGDPLSAFGLLLVALAQMVDACPPEMRAHVVKLAREAAEAMEGATGTGSRYHA